MYAEGTKISYRGHEGIVKFSCPIALTFTIGQSSDRLREVNMVVYSHSFSEIILLEDDCYHSQEHRYSDPQ